MAGRIAKRLQTHLRNHQEKFYPYQMQFHLTDFCNLRCVFCPTKTLIPDRDLDYKNELTIEQWTDLLEQAAEMGVEEFHICGGGEPFFFHKKAMAVMTKIKELGKHGEIINNGTLLRPESIKHLVEMGWDKITFSVDGPNKEIHDHIRAGTSFETITKNIAIFTQLKEENGLEKPQLCIHFVVCNLNYRSLPEMIPLCQKLGVDTFLIQALNIWSDQINDYKLNNEQEKELQGILREAHGDAEKRGISTNIPDFFKHDLFHKANVMDEAMMGAAELDHKEKVSQFPLLSAPCYMPWYNISVFADGRVLPCFILRDPGVSFKENTLEEIWESEYFRSLRQQMLTNKLGKDCAKCNPWSFTKTEEIRAQLKKEFVAPAIEIGRNEAKVE